MHDGVERFLKSKIFSVLCFAIWAALTLPRIRTLIKSPSAMEAVWVLYHSLFAVLFLVRTRPSYVSTNLVHWFIALLASFSGLFFDSAPTAGTSFNITSDALILIGLSGSFLSGLVLRRSYDFLPALRDVSTGSVYRYLRHPMYFFALVVRLGYLLNTTALNRLKPKR